MGRHLKFRSVLTALGAGSLLLGSLGLAGAAVAVDPPSGDVTPSRTLKSVTSWDAAVPSVYWGPVALDSAGDVYVVKDTRTVNEEGDQQHVSWQVVELSKDFNPDSPTPLRSITPPAAFMTGDNDAFTHIQVTSDGRLLISSSDRYLYEYPASWTSASVPTRTLDIGVHSTPLEGLDGRLYVATTGYGDGATLRVFPKTWSAESTPIQTITGAATELYSQLDFELAVEPTGNILVMGDGKHRDEILGVTQNDGPRILRFSPDADGDAEALSNIAGAATLLQAGRVAVSASGEIYASGNTGFSLGIRVYASGATGNIAPARVINALDVVTAVTSTGVVYTGWNDSVNEYGGSYTPPPPPPPSEEAPSAPRVMKVTPAIESLLVDIKKSFRQGTSPVTRYIVRATPIGAEGDAKSCAIVLPALPLSCTVKALDPDIRYDVTAVAVSADGTSPDSAVVKGTPLERRPDEPLAISKVKTTDGGARVFFTAPRAVSKKAIGYRVKMYSTSWRDDRPGCVRNYPDPDTMWCDVTGIPGGTIVWFTVTPAFKTTGAGATSPESKPIMVFSAPGVPRNVEFFMTAGEKGKFTVRPVAPKNDGGKPVTGYLVVLQDQNTSCLIELKNRTQCTFSGLESKAKYFVVVSAINVIGTGKASQPYKIRPQ